MPWAKWLWKHNHAKPIGYSKSSPKREVHSDKPSSKTRKFSNNIIYQLKELGKEEQAKHKVNRRKEIKFREEVNTVEIKKKGEIIKPRVGFFFLKGWTKSINLWSRRVLKSIKKKKRERNQIK